MLSATSREGSEGGITGRPTKVVLAEGAVCVLVDIEPAEVLWFKIDALGAVDIKEVNFEMID